jgi:hypothetical protein
LRRGFGIDGSSLKILNPTGRRAKRIHSGLSAKIQIGYTSARPTVCPFYH